MTRGYPHDSGKLQDSGPCSPQMGHALTATASDPTNGGTVASAEGSDGKPKGRKQKQQNSQFPSVLKKVRIQFSIFFVQNQFEQAVTYQEIMVLIVPS